jgi:putative flippase GtrA
MAPIILSIKDALRFMGEHGIWKSLRMKEAPWLIQFGKYGMCGVLAVIVHNLIFYWCATNLFPCIDESMPKWERAWNWLYCNLIGFAFANVLTYYTNLIFVFEGGRHSGRKEFALFTAVSFSATAPALALGFTAIIRDLSTPFAQVLFVLT